MWTVDDDNEDALLGHYGSLVVAILRGAVDARFPSRIDTTIQQVAMTHREGFSVIIIRAGAAPGLVAGPVLDRITELFDQHGDRVRGFAYVIGGRSFPARMVDAAVNVVFLAPSLEGRAQRAPARVRRRALTSAPG